MTLIDRYVARVRFWLPGARGRAAAEDVRATLAELIAAQEQWLGRPLQEAEIARELEAFGRPELIASRYSLSRPLVSAGLMPAYIRVLGVAVAGVVLVQLGLLVLLLESRAPGAALTITAGRMVTGFLWSFTAVTIVFAALTRIYGPPPAATDEC